MSDIPNLEQRLRAFAAGPDEADWKDVLRRAGEHVSAQRYIRRRVAVALIAAVAAVASVLVVVLTPGNQRDATGGRGAYCLVPSNCPPTGATGTKGPTGAIGATGPVAAVGPTGARRAITIDELRAEAPYIPLPSSDPANDDKVSTVWVADHVSDPSIPEGQLAAVVNYAASHIRLVWTHGRLNVPKFRLRVIAGVPALLVPGGGPYRMRVGPTGSTTTKVVEGMSWLYLAVGPDEVLTLQGRVPATELVDVAQSLRPPPSDASSARNAEAPPDTLSVTYNRSGGALTSITVTASPETANASSELVVLGGPPGSPGTVVYEQPIPLSAPSAAAPEQRPTWSGTLSPSDWKGGCQAGWWYTVDVISVPPGTSLADVLAHPENWGHDGNAEIDGARVLGGCGS